MQATSTDAGTSGGAKKRPRKRSRKSRSGAAQDVPTNGKTEEDEEEGGDVPAGDVKQQDVTAQPPQAQASSTQGAPASKDQQTKSKKKSVSTSASPQAGPSSTRTTSTPKAPPHSQPSSSAAPPAILSSNPHKPSVLPRPSIYGSRKYTLSVALPSSILYNVPTMELKTRLVGSIARVCALFNVDEIIVFDDGTEAPAPASTQWRREGMGRKREWNDEQAEDGGGEVAQQSNSNSEAPFDASSFMAMILQYLETPQYLRKQLFPMHPNLRLAGLLPPLDCPHHLRFGEESPYREGLVVEEPHWAARAGQGQDGETVWVNTGSRDLMQCKVVGGTWPDTGARVTVEMPSRAGHPGKLVSPRTPVQSRGLYWGYSVRVCPTLSQVFTHTPEYDLVLGTSERGDSLTDLLHATQTHTKDLPSSKPSSIHSTISPLPQNFQHALVLFGGLSGLEVAIEKDSEIPLGLADAHELCDYWIDCVEGQGSRTVRTEEAITITLARLKTTLEQLGAR